MGEQEATETPDVSTVVCCEVCDVAVVRIVGSLQYIDEAGEIRACCAAHVND